jgi:hypothetical protein
MFAQLLPDPEPSWPFVGKEPDWFQESVAPQAGTPSAGIATAPHDRRGASGGVRGLQGRLDEQRNSRRGQDLDAHGWCPLSLGHGAGLPKC